MYRSNFWVIPLLLATVSTSTSPGGEFGAGKSAQPLEVEALRNQGPAGLQHVLQAYDIERMGAKRPNPDKLERLQQLADQVAGQRHATTSRLYWYTNLETAKAKASQSGKPILSLRMLGKLTDEFSCANSRYFRTSLYANKAISKKLREHFVLHWQSVRPVPRVTIDFGDGRKLQRTITGNSAHYVLSAEGEPLDVLPGLYSPLEFQEWLDRALVVSEEFRTAARAEQSSEEKKRAVLSNYHTAQLESLIDQWMLDIQKVAPHLLLGNGYGGEFGSYAHLGDYRGGYGATEQADEFKQEESGSLINPDAMDASRWASSKAGPELPILVAIRESPAQTDKIVTDKLWNRLAKLYRPTVKLDQQTVSLMREENPNALQAGALAVSKRVVEDPILKVVRSFEESIALDTVRNKYLLERQIHQWFRSGKVREDVEALNERVYSELFLTPSSDPWLGLVPTNAYTALMNGGLSSANSGESHYGQQN